MTTPPADAGTEIAGHYRVERVLGRGSFGTTYAARDTRTGALVAVKELDLGRVDEWKTVELFEREAKILANLDHPRIPDYIEHIPIGASAPGYLVQELAPGRSLEARIGAGERFTEDQVRDIAGQLLGVLVYLSGLFPPVIHRDIKPGNVILDDEGRCYLVDFGSVRDAVEASRTGGSTVAGTFGYMAPEQLHGDASARSDLFGLGMTLIHLLTGTSPAELQRTRLKVDFRAHVKVSEPLASFIDQLIEPMPEDRFEGPQAALDGLHGLARASAAPEGGLSGDALARMVSLQAERAEAEARQARALARRNAEEVARRSPPRVTFHEDEEGLTLSIGPQPFVRRLMHQAPMSAFLLLNPGFVVVGGFPFLGRLWPVFSDDFVARAIVWLLFVIGANLLLARARGRTLSLRVAGENFVAWQGSAKEPLELGPTDRLHVAVGEPDSGGHGKATITMGDTTRSIKRLTTRDLTTLQAFAERLG